MTAWRKAPNRSCNMGWGWGRLTGLALILAIAPVIAADDRPVGNISLTPADCSGAKLTAPIAATAIGEPVRAVTLNAPTWVEATGTVPAHCRIDGSFAPIDSSATARLINFRVILPASWSRRAAQVGGGGNNGVIPNLTGPLPGGNGSLLLAGFATYGSDSGHQATFGGRGAATPPPPDADAWALNDEAVRNLGYMQMKKTHDAAMILMTRAYGAKPRFNYYIGTSQGGREALTVAQRYPADYDGVAANVPVVNFSTLTLAPILIRIQEKPLANWVTPAKVALIRREFMRQCDGLDGLVDGVIGNYMGCRAIFDVSQGAPNRHPWSAVRCADGVDPATSDTCLGDGQIATLQFVYAPYKFATPLANGVRSFGMWVPNTDPSGSGLIQANRFRGQEGAAPNAPVFSHLGSPEVVGSLMRALDSNPLEYVEGGPLNARRIELSGWLDATNPDLSRFARRGGKLLVAIGTNDTLASPGAQLAYYQSVIDRMGRNALARFARFYVLPQTGHGLTGRSEAQDAQGRPTGGFAIPNSYERLRLLFDWVEKGVAPANVVVTAGERSLPLCEYPEYPRYDDGPVTAASSYHCAKP